MWRLSSHISWYIEWPLRPLKKSSTFAKQQHAFSTCQCWRMNSGTFARAASLRSIGCSCFAHRSHNWGGNVAGKGSHPTSMDLWSSSARTRVAPPVFGIEGTIKYLRAKASSSSHKVHISRVRSRKTLSHNPPRGNPWEGRCEHVRVQPPAVAQKSDHIRRVFSKPARFMGRNPQWQASPQESPLL